MGAGCVCGRNDNIIASCRRRLCHVIKIEEAASFKIFKWFHLLQGHYVLLRCTLLNDTSISSVQNVSHERAKQTISLFFQSPAFLTRYSGGGGGKSPSLDVAVETFSDHIVLPIVIDVRIKWRQQRSGWKAPCISNRGTLVGKPSRKTLVGRPGHPTFFTTAIVSYKLMYLLLNFSTTTTSGQKVVLQQPAQLRSQEIVGYRLIKLLAQPGIFCLRNSA